MKILLSPAKSLEANPKIPISDYTIPVFVDNANYLAQKLGKLSAKKIGQMMHLSDVLADLNTNRYQNWTKPTRPTEEIKQCGFMFTGEVYKGLDMSTLSKENIKKAQEKIRILSGLYGLLKPLDLMYPYRLEMSTKWEVTPKTKNLYKYWGKQIAEQLASETSDDEVIVNLASTEYFKAVDTKTLNRKIITPVFKELKGDQFKVVMIFAKHARGAMARYIVEKNLKNIEDLKGYDVDGYRFHESMSTDIEWVFTR